MFLFLALTSLKCTYRQQNFNPGNDYLDFVGKGRPAVIRVTQTGCPFSPASQPNWDYSSSLFPHVNFMEIDCVKSPKFCNEVPIPMEDKKTVPFYITFRPNSKLPNLDSFIKNPIKSQQTDAQMYFADYAIQWLNVYPLIPPVHELDNQSINSFYKLDKYKVLVLYSSSCMEATDFLGKWLNMFGNQFEEELTLGTIDCTKYPNECERWSKDIPAAFVFDKSGAYVPIDAHILDTVESLNETLSWAIRQVRSMDPVSTPLPLPYKEKKLIFQTPIPTPQAKRIHQAKNLESRDPQKIIADFRKVNVPPLNVFRETVGYCAEGVHLQEDKNKTIDFVNFVRRLAGINNDVVYDKTREKDVQHDAFIMFQNKVISHDLYNMTNLQCYKKGKTGNAAKYSNLALGVRSAWESLFGYLFDSEDRNYQVGHRRALLDPRYNKLGVGYAQNPYTKFGASVLQMYDKNQLPIYIYDEETLPFIAWPPPGPFPVELLSSRWSFESGVLYLPNGVTTDDITISVQRDDGIVYRIKSKLVDRKVSTNGGLIFEIQPVDLPLCEAGRSATVMIHVKKGKHVDDLYVYTINFVDSNLPPPPKEDITYKGVMRYAFITEEDQDADKKMKEMETKICEVRNMTGDDAKKDSWGYKQCEYGRRIFTNDEIGTKTRNPYNMVVTPYSGFNSLFKYDCDMLSKDIDIGTFDLSSVDNQPWGREFNFHFNPFKGTIIMRSSQKLTINDPSLTDITINCDIKDGNSFKSATIETLGQAKSVKIVLNGKPSLGSKLNYIYQSSMKVYTGLPCQSEIVGQTLYEEGKYDISVDTFYDHGLNIRISCINNSDEYFLQGSTMFYERPQLIGREWNDLGFLRPKKRVMEVHFSMQHERDVIMPRNLPSRRRDYLFTAYGPIYGLSFEQSPEMYNKVRKLMIGPTHETAGLVYSVDLLAKESDPFSRSLDFEELNYLTHGVRETNFKKLTSSSDRKTFYNRHFTFDNDYKDQRSIKILDSTNSTVNVNDNGFVYQLKGVNSITISATTKRTQASIIFTNEYKKKNVTLDSVRSYVIREISDLNLKIKKAETKVYLKDSNVTLSSPLGYSIESFDVKLSAKVYLISSNSVKIKNLYIRKNSVVEFMNVEIENCVVEDCQAKIIGGKINNLKLLGATLTLKNVDVTKNNLEIVKRDAISQIIIESGSDFSQSTIDYDDHDFPSQTFALFKKLSKNQCITISQRIDKLTDHKIECVEQKDVSSTGTGLYKLMMNGKYVLPIPPQDPIDDGSKIPDAIPPVIDDPNMKYCLYSVTPELCGNFKYKYDTWNISSIFSKFDPNPVVYVHEEVTFIQNFVATGNITFKGKGKLNGRIEVSPLCAKFVSEVGMKNARLSFLDEGTTMGYAESVYSPMFISVIQKKKPNKGTTSLSALLYRSYNSTTAYINTEKKSQYFEDYGILNYGISSAYNRTSQTFRVDYTREVIPNAVFCIGMRGDLSQYNCREITYDQIKESIGKSDKVKIYFGRKVEIKSDIYPDIGRDYTFISNYDLTFHYDSRTAGSIFSLVIENSTGLKFVSDENKPISIQAVTLKNVIIEDGQQDIKFLNLFATNEIKAKFAPEDKKGKYLLSPDGNKVSVEESGTYVISPETKDLSVSSSASSISLEPVIEPNHQTSLTLTGSKETTFNVNIPDVKVTLPLTSNASVVLKNVKNLEVGLSNTTISMITLDKDIDSTTISGLDKADVINVNYLHINGNTSIIGDNGKVNVGNLKVAKGVESQATNVILSSKVAIDGSSVLLLQKASTGKDLDITMNGDSNSLPFISTVSTVGEFSPKSLTVNAGELKYKLLDINEKILVNGISKDECSRLAGVTTVKSTDVYYPMCIESYGTYNLILSKTKPAPIPDVEDNKKEKKPDGKSSSATIIGVVVAIVAVVAIIIVFVVISKRKMNRQQTASSSDSSGDMKTRLSEDVKLPI